MAAAVAAKDMAGAVESGAPGKALALLAGINFEEVDMEDILPRKGLGHRKDCMDYTGPQLDCLNHPELLLVAMRIVHRIYGCFYQYHLMNPIPDSCHL